MGRGEMFEVVSGVQLPDSAGSFFNGFSELELSGRGSVVYSSMRPAA